jgi:hypothetical protein
MRLKLDGRAANLMGAARGLGPGERLVCTCGASRMASTACAHSAANRRCAKSICPQLSAQCSPGRRPRRYAIIARSPYRPRSPACSATSLGVSYCKVHLLAVLL